MERAPAPGKPVIESCDAQVLEPDQVVPGSGCCGTEYVRAVTVDELYAYLYQQSCELHDFLHSAVVLEEV